MLIIVAMFGNLFPEANGWVCIEGGGTESVVCGEIYGMCVKCSFEHSPTRYHNKFPPADFDGNAVGVQYIILSFHRRVSQAIQYSIK